MYTKLDEMLIRLHHDGWMKGKQQVKIPYEYTLDDEPKIEAKQAILADLLAMPELQEPPKHWSTDKDTKELMDASVADYHEDIRQALTDYFEGEV